MVTKQEKSVVLEARPPISPTQPVKKNRAPLYRGLLILFFVVYGTVLTVLYFLQGSATGPERYSTDLPAHIHYALSGEPQYSIVYLMLKWLYQLSGTPFFIALFWTAVSIATMLVAQKALCLLLPQTNRYLLWLPVIACNFVVPIFLPFLNKSMYHGVQSCTVYHNIPYSVMRLFSLVTLVLFFRLRERYKNHIRFGEWLLFCVSLFLSSWAKPNFLIAFAPAMAGMLLWDLYKEKGKILGKCVWFGSAVLPSVLLLLYQNLVLFPADSNSHIAIGFAKHLQMISRYPVLSLLQSVAFPLLILLCNLGELKRDKVYGLTWLMCLISFLEYIFIYETGSRIAHGNFGWGYVLMLYFVFLLSVCKLIQNCASDWREHRIKKRLGYYIPAFVLLGTHFVDGIIYFVDFCIKFFA